MTLYVSWHMKGEISEVFHQSSSNKGHHFLSLRVDKKKRIEPSYLKREGWLRYISISISLCARATNAILNYPPVNTEGSFQTPNSHHSCPCGTSNMETIQHIVNNCLYFIYKLEDGMIIKKLVSFLADNPAAFAWSVGFVTCFDPCLIVLPSVVLRSFIDRSGFCMLLRTAIGLQLSCDRALRISPDETRIYSEGSRMIGVLPNFTRDIVLTSCLHPYNQVGIYIVYLNKWK